MSLKDTLEQLIDNLNAKDILPSDNEFKLILEIISVVSIRVITDRTPGKRRAINLHVHWAPQIYRRPSKYDSASVTRSCILF